MKTSKSLSLRETADSTKRESAPPADECGEDVGDNLTSGKTVCESWIDGVSDWWVDNHPMVAAAEVAATYNSGNFDWPNTTLDRDHFWSHGTTVADIWPADKYWLSWQWAEG
jgi:hypothetical protein